MTETSLTLGMSLIPILPPPLPDSVFSNHSAVFDDVEGRCKDIWETFSPWSNSWNSILKPLKGSFLVGPLSNQIETACSFFYMLSLPLLDIEKEGKMEVRPFEDAVALTLDSGGYFLVSREINKENTEISDKDLLYENETSLNFKIPLHLDSKFPRFPWRSGTVANVDLMRRITLSYDPENKEIMRRNATLAIEGKIRTGFFSKLEMRINCNGTVASEGDFEDNCTWNLERGGNDYRRGSLKGDKDKMIIEIDNQERGEKVWQTVTIPKSNGERPSQQLEDGGGKQEGAFGDSDVTFQPQDGDQFCSRTLCVYKDTKAGA